MNLFDTVKAEGYLDYYPWMSNKPHEEPDGNTLLYTSILHYLSYKRGELRPGSAIDFLKAINSCWESPGVLNRGYGRTDFQAHDDYVGVCLFSKFCIPMDTENPAFKIVGHGIRSGWIYNNHRDVKDEFRSYHGRYLSVVPHYKVCSLFKISYYEQLSMSLDVLYSSFFKKDDSSSKIQDWIKCEAVEGDYLFPTISSIVFNNRINMADVFSTYFNPQHPFARHFRKEI